MAAGARATRRDERARNWVVSPPSLPRARPRSWSWYSHNMVVVVVVDTSRGTKGGVVRSPCTLKRLAMLARRREANSFFLFPTTDRSRAPSRDGTTVVVPAVSYARGPVGSDRYRRYRAGIRDADGRAGARHTALTYSARSSVRLVWRIYGNDPETPILSSPRIDPAKSVPPVASIGRRRDIGLPIERPA